MDVEVNWAAVLLATAASMVVGSVWYLPGVFGNAWMRASKIDPSKMKGDRRSAPMLIALISSFLTAFVLAHVTWLSDHFYGGSFLHNALSTAFWLWLGLVLTTLYLHNSFEGRPRKLTLINAGNRLVTLLVAGLIIGVMQP